MRCLITGVAGFIGSHLAKRLLIEGHEVWGIDSLTDYYPRSLKERNLAGPRNWKRFAFIEKDLLELDLKPLLDGMDWVFHLAAQPGVRTSWGQGFGGYVHCNILATEHLLEALRETSGIQRVIYASSSSVYGQPKRLPMKENMVLQPESPYGATKLFAENLCKMYHCKHGVPVVMLRYFTVYGPHQRPDMVLQKWCKAIAEREPLLLYGDGSQARDFTFVSDVVEATLLATRSEAAVGEILNIGSGTQTTLRDVLDFLREVSNTPLDLTFERPHYGEVQTTLADISRAQRLLGYTPSVSLREGLARQFASTVETYGRVRDAVTTL